jgi:hypothetical protein
MVGCTELLSTADGGVTWTNITPPAAKNSTLRATLLGVGLNASQGAYSSGKPVSKRFLGSVSPSTDPNLNAYQGFDKSLVIPIKPINDMQTWWNDSPYWDTNVYLPKSPNRFHCPGPKCRKDSNLTTGWVTEVQKQGWGLIPTWFGLQAPCACDPNKGGCQPFNHTFDYAPKTAQQQGIAEADAAVKQADALGIGGIVIYHDIEYYTPSHKCSPAVVAFLDGWVSELKKKGVLFAGVYGNPGPAAGLLPSDPPAGRCLDSKI